MCFVSNDGLLAREGGQFLVSPGGNFRCRLTHGTDRGCEASQLTTILPPLTSLPTVPWDTGGTVKN